MKYLIVVAHPLQESIAHRSAQLAAETLAHRGHEVTLLDLYLEHFDPVLSADDLRAFRTGEYDKKISALHQLVQEAQGLILCFPTWWHGPPAIMRGFFEKIFVPEVGYAISKGGLRPLLTGLTHIDVLTSYNSPWWLVRVLNMSADRSSIIRGLRLACAPQAKVAWRALYRVNRRKPDDIRKHMEKVRAALNRRN